MNPKDTALLKSILAKNIVDILPSERVFLKARAPYLNDDQLKRYESIIGPIEIEGDKEESIEMTYNQLLDKARKLGYTGNRPKKEILKAYIEQHEV